MLAFGRLAPGGWRVKPCAWRAAQRGGVGTRTTALQVVGSEPRGAPLASPRSAERADLAGHHPARRLRQLRAPAGPRTELRGGACRPVPWASKRFPRRIQVSGEPWMSGVEERAARGARRAVG